MNSSFRPRQAVSIDAETIREFLGSCTEDVAYDVLRPLVPFSDGSRVHDNGCGAGAVTEALCRLHALKDIPTPLIAATDVNATAYASLLPKVRHRGWPVEVAQMDCRELGFPGDAFSHSFTNFVFLQARRDDRRCASEMYRTLQPGGIAVVTTWEDLPTMAVFRQTHQRMHGDEAGLPAMLKGHDYGKEDVRRAMADAGFEESRLKTDLYSTRVRIEDSRRWCEIGWSMCGAQVGGWTQKDEDEWDEAICVAHDVLTAGPWYLRDEDGGNKGWLVMTASATSARK